MPWDVDKAVKYLKVHASSNSLGRCARYTRLAIQAGGITLMRTHSAKDYGASLIIAGFTEVTAPWLKSPEKGDVVVIQGFVKHEDGHMAMFDGKQWISDFAQRGLYPGPGYAKIKPDYSIYRVRTYSTSAGQTSR